MGVDAREPRHRVHVFLLADARPPRRGPAFARAQYRSSQGDRQRLDALWHVGTQALARSMGPRGFDSAAKLESHARGRSIRERSRTPYTLTTSPASTKATPRACNGASVSSSSSAPLTKPDTGISNANGDMSAVGYRWRSRAHDAKPKSVDIYPRNIAQPQVSALACATACHAALPPSNAYDSAASGNGGTRLDQTTSANMSSACSPAARLAITLPTPHASAATITSMNPRNVAPAP